MPACYGRAAWKETECRITVCMDALKHTATTKNMWLGWPKGTSPVWKAQQSPPLCTSGQRQVHEGKKKKERIRLQTVSQTFLSNIRVTSHNHTSSRVVKNCINTRKAFPKERNWGGVTMKNLGLQFFSLSFSLTSVVDGWCYKLTTLNQAVWILVLISPIY